MTRKEKRMVIASRLSSLTGTIKRLQSHIDNLLDMQEKQYIQKRDSTLFRLLDLQTELNKQYRELVIESLNLDYREV